MNEMDWLLIQHMFYGALAAILGGWLGILALEWAVKRWLK